MYHNNTFKRPKTIWSSVVLTTLRSRSLLGFYALITLLMLYTFPTYAYIGPGLGVTMAGALWGPIAAFFTAIAILIYFPIRYTYRKRKKRKANAQEAQKE